MTDHSSGRDGGPVLPDKTVFTTGEVAKFLGVAPRSVSKWFDSGRLRGYRIPGSQDRRITREHLDSFLKEYPSLVKTSKAPAEKPAAPKPDTGGSAFPLPRQRDWSGMSLRDWFAGMALLSGYCDDPSDPERMARHAYQLADAMLAERESAADRETP